MTLDGKKVFVTGAGCLGSRLVQRLLTDGAAVTAYDLSAERLLELPTSVHTIAGDINDAERVASAMAGADIVIHTAAALDGPPEVQQKVNVAGSRTVVTAAIRAQVERFVHVSSIAVYGFPAADVVTEDMGPRPNEQVYSTTKAQAETLVRESTRQAGIPSTVIRPAGIFGPGARYFTGTYMKRARRKPIIFVGRGLGSLPVIFVDDVADLAATVAVHPGAVDEVFNCAIDPPPTHREYLHGYARLAGHTSWVGFPMTIARYATYAAVPFARRGTYARHLPRNLMEIDRFVTYSGAKAAKLLGWRPRYDVTSGIEASIPWLRKEGLLD